MMDMNLPNDIIRSILARLPVKSLIRFKIVCKAWHALMIDPNFIDEQFSTRASITKDNCVLVVRRIRDPWCCKQAELDDESGSESDSDSDSFDNTVLSLVSDEPSSGIKYFDLDHLPFPNTNGYKAIKIWTFKYRSGSPRYEYKVEECSLSSNKLSWKEVDDVIVPHGVLTHHRDVGIYLRGKFYWCSKIILPQKLYYYDFSKRIFDEIELPDPPTKTSTCICNGSYWRWWAVLNDTIALVSYPIAAQNDRTEIWLMNEDGETVCWIKYTTLDSRAEKWYVLGSWKKGHLIYQDLRDGILFSVDLTTLEIRSLQIKLGYSAHDVPILYNESLYPLVLV